MQKSVSRNLQLSLVSNVAILILGLINDYWISQNGDPAGEQQE